MTPSVLRAKSAETMTMVEYCVREKTRRKRERERDDGVNLIGQAKTYL